MLGCSWLLASLTLVFKCLADMLAFAHSRMLTTNSLALFVPPASDTPYGGKFGYSTLADGAQKEVDVLALVEGTKNGASGGGAVDLGGDVHDALNDDGSSSSSEEDNSAPVSGCGWWHQSVLQLDRFV